MTLSASEQISQGPLGLICVFLPWLYLMQGGLKPFAGWPSNSGRSLLMLNEATTAS